MTRVNESIDVNVPQARAFELVTDEAALPEFLSLVTAVESVDDGTASLWTVELAGQRRQISTRRTAYEAPTLVRYEPVSDQVEFLAELRTEALNEHSSRLSIVAEFNAGGVAEKLGLAKGIAQTAIRSQLKNAKEYLERHA